MPHSHAALKKLFAFLGMFLGFSACLKFQDLVKGPMWWQLQPLAVTFAPILVGVLGGMFLGIWLALVIPCRCPYCGGRSWNRRGGQPKRWGYWCDTCGRDGARSPDEQPMINSHLPAQ